MIAYFKKRYAQSKVRTAFIAVVGAFCVGVAVYFAVKGLLRNMLLALLCCVLVTVCYNVAEYYVHLSFAAVPTVLLTLVLVGGLVLGPGLDFYFRFPHWDTVLHTASGFLFAAFGYAFADGFVSDEIVHRKVVCTVCGIAFSLAVALLWEMFEYAGTSFLGMDMQEDTIIYNIRSFLLAGSHNDIVELDNITQTIIYYGNGQQWVIDGYLDVGLQDTLDDMLVCLIGSLVLPIALAVSVAFGGRLDKYLVPQRINTKFQYADVVC